MTPSPHNATRGADGVGTSSQPAPSIYDEMLSAANFTRDLAERLRLHGYFEMASKLDEDADDWMRKMMEQANEQ